MVLRENGRGLIVLESARARLARFGGRKGVFKAESAAGLACIERPLAVEGFSQCAQMEKPGFTCRPP